MAQGKDFFFFIIIISERRAETFEMSFSHGRCPGCVMSPDVSVCLQHFLAVDRYIVYQYRACDVAAAGGPTVRIAPVQQCRQAQFGSRTLSILTLAPVLSALSVVSLSLSTPKIRKTHTRKS